ncbi:MAG: response regulator [Elusimicrobiota bacterium]|jgi:two-component system alkaline phosphatase synthesis response regulator PhoP
MAGQAPRKKVLVIDDDVAIAEALSARLSQDGLEVRVCPYGEQGIPDAKAFLPDLIILDVMMPGVHGIHVLSELRRVPELAETHILVISGMRNQEIEEQVLALGADFVPKTGEPMGIIAKAKRCLGVL